MKFHFVTVVRPIRILKENQSMRVVGLRCSSIEPAPDEYEDRVIIKADGCVLHPDEPVPTGTLMEYEGDVKMNATNILSIAEVPEED